MRKTFTRLSVLALLMMMSGWANAENVTFNTCSWDDTNKKVVTTSTTHDCTPIEGQNWSWMALGQAGKETWYVAKEGTVTRKVLVIFGTVHLVLADRSELTCNHIKLEAQNNAVLHVHEQAGSSSPGTLNVINYSPDKHRKREYKNAAAIGSGGGEGNNSGSLYVHGGNIVADQARLKEGNLYKDDGNYGAGIGGGKKGCIDPKHQVVIYAGYVNSHGGYDGAGIGGGYDAHQGGPVLIYGGRVFANGGFEGAGIGGGYSGNGGVVKIYGGRVEARGAYDWPFSTGCAGIGAGRGGEGGNVFIYGGETYAYGSGAGAGIGGFGYNRSRTLEVHGGYLFASSGTKPESALPGIGGGHGEAVLITGGTVFAVTANKHSAIIGGGYNFGFKIYFDADNGSLILNPGLKVSYGDEADAVKNPDHREGKFLHLVSNANDRVNQCQNRKHYCVQIEPCDHKGTGATFKQVDDSQHSVVCKVCGYEGKENHKYTDGKCACGKEDKNTPPTYTVTIHTTTDGKTYTGKEEKVVKGKEYMLPVPEAKSGLFFMGYLKTESADAIEMKDDEEGTLLAGGTAVTPDADTHYFARYRYDYQTEWTWNEARTDASVKISNALINESTKITAEIVEDTEAKLEPTETTFGERYFTASAGYVRSSGVTYQFYDYATLKVFPTNPKVTLDTQSKDYANTEKLINYWGLKADVTVNNLTLKKDGKIHPISLPFSVSASDNTPLKGAVIYTLSTAQMKNHEFAMTFKQGTTVEPGMPCFYRFSETGADVKNPVFEDVLIEETNGLVAEKQYTPDQWSADDETLELWGSFEPEAIDEVNRELFFLMDGDGISLKPESLGAFSSYFYIASPLDEQGYNRVRSVSLTFESDRFSKKLTYSWDGDGSEAQPYIISSPEQLNEMQEELNGSNGASLEGKYFRQGANIKFDKTVTNNYTPVKTFKGHYDGAGYVISGLNINTPAANAGLFADVADGSTVQNVIIADASISGAAAGGIAYRLLGSSMIDNCHVLKDVSISATNPHVTSNISAGGIVAYMDEGTPSVTNCTSHATLSSAVGYAGGIVGTLVKGSLANCIYLGGKPTTHDDSFWSAITFNFSDGNATVEDCYFTNPALKDGKAVLMPQYDKDVDNTDFLTLLTMRDRFLTGNSGLSNYHIGYDITLNKRATLSAEQNADGTWKSKAYSVCLPFDVNLRQQFDDDAPVVIDHVSVYKPHRLDNGIFSKELIFAGVFPELKAGEAYIVVVKKGSVSLSAQNATVVSTPAEADKVVSESDISEQIGEWSGTFERIDNDEMTTRCLYIAQKDKTFKRATLFTNSWINPFTGYFAPLEAYIISFLNHRTIGVKYVPTGQSDGDEEGEVTDFPADEFDSDNELPDDETGISTVTVGSDDPDRYYDLQGRQITGKPAKGVYIKDGKKVIVK